jgi:hypothetical protein
MMFDMMTLKNHILKNNNELECPVKDCYTPIKMMKKGDPQKLDSYLLGNKPKEEKQKFEGYYCKKHRIYVTPSTLIYEDYCDNLLWDEEKDKRILDKILRVKRVKAQLHHDNSEDSVTWNVFRFLERNDLINGFLSNLTRTPVKSSQVIYWSYSQAEEGTWTLLKDARDEFGEQEKRGSEPDIIITADKALFFIEAKIKAGNETEPSDKSNSKEYRTGGKNWFSEVFDSDYDIVADKKKKYELMRFWLLGSWIAEQQHLDFFLINLVLSEREPCIEEIFRQHINENERRYFRRVTWENIYEYILKASINNEKEIMLNYFRNKTIGYKDGKLQRAFSV